MEVVVLMTGRGGVPRGVMLPTFYTEVFKHLRLTFGVRYHLPEFYQRCCRRSAAVKLMCLLNVVSLLLSNPLPPPLYPSTTCLRSPRPKFRASIIYATQPLIYTTQTLIHPTQHLIHQTLPLIHSSQPQFIRYSHSSI
ncbi:hypothetical protein E2C01_072268 [Portunus trituberculatus]|uniref:Uncharacterized protein n=1 Tax=Portunus trituberculatus TaxID=210409 RepID=A0A5B7HZF1_PORTR|nr:hypothetical protein [Portunus trituberculatus]